MTWGTVCGKTQYQYVINAQSVSYRYPEIFVCNNGASGLSPKLIGYGNGIGNILVDLDYSNDAPTQSSLKKMVSGNPVYCRAVDNYLTYQLANYTPADKWWAIAHMERLKFSSNYSIYRDFLRLLRYEQRINAIEITVGTNQTEVWGNPSSLTISQKYFNFSIACTDKTSSGIAEEILGYFDDRKKIVATRSGNVIRAYVNYFDPSEKFTIKVSGKGAIKASVKHTFTLAERVFTVKYGDRYLPQMISNISVYSGEVVETEQNQWDSSREYQANDNVFYNGVYYTAIVKNKGAAPSLDSQQWQPGNNWSGITVASYLTDYSVGGVDTFFAAFGISNYFTDGDQIFQEGFQYKPSFAIEPKNYSVLSINDTLKLRSELKSPDGKVSFSESWSWSGFFNQIIIPNNFTLGVTRLKEWKWSDAYRQYQAITASSAAVLNIANGELVFSEISGEANSGSGGTGVSPIEPGRVCQFATTSWEFGRKKLAIKWRYFDSEDESSYDIYNEEMVNQFTLLFKKYYSPIEPSGEFPTIEEELAHFEKVIEIYQQIYDLNATIPIKTHDWGPYTINAENEIRFGGGSEFSCILYDVYPVKYPTELMPTLPIIPVLGFDAAYSFAHLLLNNIATATDLKNYPNKETICYVVIKPFTFYLCNFFLDLREKIAAEKKFSRKTREPLEIAGHVFRLTILSARHTIIETRMDAVPHVFYGNDEEGLGLHKDVYLDDHNVRQYLAYLDETISCATQMQFQFDNFMRDYENIVEDINAFLRSKDADKFSPSHDLELTRLNILSLVESECFELLKSQYHVLINNFLSWELMFLLQPGKTHVIL